MGREIRRVIPNWQHPQEFHPYTGKLQYKPLSDGSYKDILAEWTKNKLAWDSGTDPKFEQAKKDYGNTSYEEYNNEPKAEYYRPDWKEGEATWYQVYETVSEGTPVSPPFATQAELVEYLVANGDFWDQERREELKFRPKQPWDMDCDPWAREAAEKFVYGDGWAPTLIGRTNGKLEQGHRFQENKV